MSNILTNSGDSFTIKLDFPITNISGLVSYTESITGTQGNLTSELRYTLDLLNWSEWVILTNSALQEVDISILKDLRIEIKYTKTDNTGDITVNWFNLLTTTPEVEDILEDTVFRVLDSNDRVETSLWAENVLEKVYRRGIIPNYIPRGEDFDDRDYIDFWRSMVSFFSMFVVFCRRFESLEKLDILKKLLDSHRLYYKRDSCIEDLVTIVLSSSSVFQTRGTSYSEIERLLSRRVDSCSELFIFSDSHPGTNGIFLDSNSILERYLYNQPEVEFLSIQDTEFFHNISETEGVLAINSTSYIESDKFTIDPTINYELVFLVKGSGSLTSVIKAFDPSGLEVNLVYLDSNSANPPLDNISFADNDNWYLVRLVVFGVDNQTIILPDMYGGTNLQLVDSVCRLQVRMSFVGDLEIKDIFFKIVHTKYSKSFIQSSELVDAWYINRSTQSNSLDVIHSSLVNYSKTILLNQEEETCTMCDQGTEMPVIVIDGFKFILYKHDSNLTEELMRKTLQVNDTVSGSYPGGHLKGTYLGGDPTDFNNPLVWDNWSGLIEE